MQTKLTDADAKIVRDVFTLWRTGRVPTPKTRVSKKLVFDTWQSWLDSERERKKRLVIESKRDNVWIVTDEATLQRLEAVLDNEPIIAIDTETTGVNWLSDRIVGVAGYFPNADIAWYVPFGHTTGQRQLPRDGVLRFWRKCVTGRKTVLHNAKFDLHMTANEGVEPDPPFWDTMVAQRILSNNEQSYGLKQLYDKYIAKGESELVTFADLFDDAIIYDKDIELAGIYAAGDGYKTWRLYEFQKPYIDTRDRLRVVWYEIEQKLVYIDFKTERNGVNVNLDWLANLREELVPRLDEAKRKVIEAFSLPDDFNFNSPQQMAHLVYDLAGADPTFPRRFKKNDRSTASDVLDALCDDLPSLEPLLEYRMIEKLLGTYVDKIPHAIEPTTGRLHFQLDSTTADTGRYGSRGYGNKTEPRGLNIQNISSRTKEGKKVRMAFVPSPGYVFLSADLSAIEPRKIADILHTEYGDNSMRSMFLAGLDPYVELATEIFEEPRENCVDGAYSRDGSYQPRKAMKNGLLARMYGQSEKAFARKQHVSEEVAARFFRRTDEIMPGLKAFVEDTKRRLLTVGSIAYAETPDGRKRRFDGHRGRYAELQRLEAIPYRRLSDSERDRLWTLRREVSSVDRAAANMRVQGACADILKRIIIRMYDVCQERGWRYLFSVHDEIFLEVPKEALTPEAIDVVRDVMTRTVEISVPLKTDVAIQPYRWMDEVRPTDWDFEKGAPKSV